MDVCKSEKEKAARRLVQQIKAEILEPEEKFEMLALLWKEDTKHLSSLQKVFRHPAYQAIIAMGLSVVSYILRDLQKEPDQPDHWFYALGRITGECIIPQQDAGNMIKATEHWLAWGSRKGFL